MDATCSHRRHSHCVPGRNDRHQFHHGAGGGGGGWEELSDCDVDVGVSHGDVDGFKVCILSMHLEHTVHRVLKLQATIYISTCINVFL